MSVTLEQIEDAVETTNGDRAEAARILGIDIQEIYDATRNSPKLQAIPKTSRGGRPRKLKAPTVEETLSAKPNLPASVSEAEARLATAIAEEDAKFRKGISNPAFGLSKEEINFAASIQSFQGRHFINTVSMLSGGMSASAVRVMMKIKELSERLTDGFEGEDRLEEERMVWSAFHKCCESLVSMAQTAAEGMQIRAKIEVWKRQLQDQAQKKQRAKPGFAPLEAQVYEVK